MTNYEPTSYRRMLIYRCESGLTQRNPVYWYYIVGAGRPDRDYPTIKAAKKAIDNYYNEL